MIDIQNTLDTREVPLNKVGVKNLEYPVKVLDKEKGFQFTTAAVDLFVNLPHNYKGTHMSRFVDIFHKYHQNLSMKNFLCMLEEIRNNLDAEKAFCKMTFPFFIEKAAPVSGEKGMMSYILTYEGEVSATEKKFFIKAKVPVTTVCPCSKAISERGAHNQRGVVTVKLQNTSFFWIEDVIKVIENSASSGLYSLLKRPDEKFVTEAAYDNPRFVEDVVREVYLGLKNFKGSEKPFATFSVECENFESIHNHNAYAFTSFDGQN